MYSNRRPRLPNNICSISPSSGYSLTTEFTLDCSSDVVNDGNNYIYNFYNNDIFIDNYLELDNDPKTNLTIKDPKEEICVRIKFKNSNYCSINFIGVLRLGTGNQTIKAIILDVNDYAQCIDLNETKVSLPIQ